MDRGLVFSLIFLLLVTLTMAQQGWGGQAGGWGANPAGSLAGAVDTVSSAVQGAVQGALAAGQRG
ncbi:hypothetical protein V3C99_014638 [Haemonchus contortus]|uniref:Uncharacterized protein n=1 Tax=Haemonchus contortus TaxID=6289 RepID=A0A7I4Z6T6_HAECO